MITEDEAYMTSYELPDDISAAKNYETIWKRDHRCGGVYYESRLEGVFNEGLREYIRFPKRKTGAQTVTTHYKILRLTRQVSSNYERIQ